MKLEDQLRAVLNEEADMRTAIPPDVAGLISGGRTRRRRRNSAWVGGSVLAAVVAAGGVYGVAQLGDEADPASRVASQPSSQSLPDAPQPVEIDPGTYTVSADRDYVLAPYSVTVPAGWEVQHGTDLGKHGDQPGALGLAPYILDQVRLTDDACTGPETLGTRQTNPAGLVAGLRAQGSGLRVSDPTATTVGGRAATRIDLDYPGNGPLSNCRLANEPGGEPGGLQVWSGYFVMFPDESASVYVVDVGGGSQLFVTRIQDDASAADRAELRSVLDSISFQTGAT